MIVFTSFILGSIVSFIQMYRDRDWELNGLWFMLAFPLTGLFWILLKIVGF
jgi:hypothetical protein